MSEDSRTNTYWNIWNLNAPLQNWCFLFDAVLMTCKSSLVCSAFEEEKNSSTELAHIIAGMM